MERQQSERVQTILFWGLAAVAGIVFYILHMNTSEKLQRAIARRNWRGAKKLLEECPKLPETKTLGVLVEAIEAGAAIDFVEKLLKKGANPNERSRVRLMIDVCAKH